MNTQVQDLTVCWWKKHRAMQAAEDKIAAEREKFEALRDQCSDLEQRICKVATEGTKVITVEPGISIVLVWNADHEFHDLEVVQGENMQSRVWDGNIGPPEEEA